MTLRIKWEEKESFGYTDEVPDWMLANEGRWRRASHVVTGPRRGMYRALCDVRTDGKVVTLDYRPYEENKKEFHVGALRLTFGNVKRLGEPKVAWRDASSRVFEKFKASVTRVQSSGSIEPISEEEVCFASEPFGPSNLTDARQHILASLAVRQGQQKFRNALKAAYKNTCALTGCSVVEVLEAAHIIGYRGKHTNHVRNGLLLRADIHTLFDMGLVGIDPRTWTAVVHPCLQEGPYHEIHGSTPHLPEKRSEKPDARALMQHLKSYGLS